MSRKSFFQALVATAAAVPAFALTANAEEGSEVQLASGISDTKLKEIVTSDILERQFLATGMLTRSIYLPTATFTDEIDTYGLDQWMKGTSKLFVGEKSKVRLVGDVQVSPDKVEFRFDEDLMFRIPFRPVVSLTGTVVLARDSDTGLIKSYQEFWDQSVVEVLKSAKF